MKRLIICLSIVALGAACTIDDDNTNHETAEVRSGPDAGEVAPNIGGGECLPEEAERGTCGGGGGSSGGGGGQGGTFPCNPGEVWNGFRCVPQPCPSPHPDYICGRANDGRCWCWYSPR